jgi:hypothetical protein
VLFSADNQYVGIPLSCAVALALVGLSLPACSHSRHVLEQSPWIWSSQWRGGEQAGAPAQMAAVDVATPTRVSLQRTAVVPAETYVARPAPTMVQVERQPAMRRPDGKRAKRPKRGKR